MFLSTSLSFRRAAAIAALTALWGLLPCPAQTDFITLPKPRTDGGMPLMKALSERKTTREFSDRALTPQMLSDLLWAAFGVNRTKADRPGPGRTAPSAMNRQEIDLYVALPDGLYLYEAEPNRLRLVAAGDIRAKTGPAAAAKAAATILYVTDGAKAAMAGRPAPDPAASNINVGFIGQNVYLFAASEGLGAWFRATIPDAQSLAQIMKLRPEQHLLYAQTVGYPPK
jgi:hypothetical protein